MGKEGLDILLLNKIKKRDGSIVDFNIARISSAVYKAMYAVKEREGKAEGNIESDPLRIANNVVKDLEDKVKKEESDYMPDIEEIQSLVERNLILAGMPSTAKGYILYRQERSEVRHHKQSIPKETKELMDKNKKFFQNSLGEFIYFRTYSKWQDDKGRREVWNETVDRFMNFMKKNLGKSLPDDDYKLVEQSILNQEAMPSMRLLWSAGKAAEASNVSAYNCSFIIPQEIRDFGEILNILMCGTGVGFSVENQFVQKLPIIQKQNGQKKPTHVVGDSKEGWSDAFVEGIQTWYDGYDIDFDYSKVRPAGAKLKTMGGRSSGPVALEELLTYTKAKILNKQGRRLSSLDVHDIVCEEGEIVQVGGVRRSALISLSDLDDIKMRGAKSGNFYIDNPQRKMANNSAVYEEKPTATEFMREWLALAESGTGERGIFNRGGLKYQLPERRLALGLEHLSTMGCNPCGEINLRHKGFCNLTEVVARSEDTINTLIRKVRAATILGTYQSMLTHFPYLSNEWKTNAEEERLLGVSITGQMDCPHVQNPEVLKMLREVAVETNKEYANKFGIHQSVAVTTGKPSGTVAQLVNASPGGHPRWSDYYLRNVRISATDPLFHMLKDQKYPYSPEVGENMNFARNYVVPFPVTSPKGSITRKNLDAISQLENWKRIKENFTEHNPSVSIYVGEKEWIDTAQWVYNNWDQVGGLSFFPRNDHIYKLAPFEEISKERFDKEIERIPNIDYSQILLYEQDDSTLGAREYACVGGSCEVDLGPKDSK